MRASAVLPAKDLPAPGRAGDDWDRADGAAGAWWEAGAAVGDGGVGIA